MLGLSRAARPGTALHGLMELEPRRRITRPWQAGTQSAPSGNFEMTAKSLLCVRPAEEPTVTGPVCCRPAELLRETSLSALQRRLAPFRFDLAAAGSLRTR